MKKICSISILFFISFSLWAQTSEKQLKLESRKAEILKEIRAVQNMLKTVQSKERNVLWEMDEQKRKIKLSHELINNIQQQINSFSKSIAKNQKEIAILKKELDVLKTDYAKIIVNSYKSRSNQSKIMFVLSSENYTQAFKRIQYMKQYANYRKKQGEELKIKSDAFSAVVDSLIIRKKKQNKLLEEAEIQKKNIEKDKLKQQKLMTMILKDQKKYNNQIKKKQEETKAIDKQIQKLIRDAISEANRKARESTAKASGKKATTTVNSATFELTPEGKVVADSFKASQGRLPWPVKKGYILLPFGDQPHPIQKHLTIHNSGIEINTEPGSKARSVFQGVVLQVQLINGRNKAVLIQHGDYITVYQNLSDVFVKKGDKVSLKQDIGIVNTNTSGQTVLKFVLSHNTTINNPQSWLSRRN